RRHPRLLFFIFLSLSRSLSHICNDTFSLRLLGASLFCCTSDAAEGGWKDGEVSWGDDNDGGFLVCCCRHDLCRRCRHGMLCCDWALGNFRDDSSMMKSCGFHVGHVTG